MYLDATLASLNIITSAYSMHIKLIISLVAFDLESTCILAELFANYLAKSLR
jgi:hypothetical protein